jgi:hypothetical protein
MLKCPLTGEVNPLSAQCGCAASRILRRGGGQSAQCWACWVMAGRWWWKCMPNPPRNTNQQQQQWRGGAEARRAWSGGLCQCSYCVLGGGWWAPLVCAARATRAACSRNYHHLTPRIRDSDTGDSCGYGFCTDTDSGFGYCARCAVTRGSVRNVHSRLCDVHHELWAGLATGLCREVEADRLARQGV